MPRDFGALMESVPFARSTTVFTAASTSSGRFRSLGFTVTTVSVRSLAMTCTAPWLISIDKAMGWVVSKVGMCTPVFVNGPIR